MCKQTLRFYSPSLSFTTGATTGVELRCVVVLGATDGAVVFVGVVGVETVVVSAVIYQYNSGS